MDAKITKQRLSNLLAYDWLKMLAVIIVAVFALILIFTMTATNPTTAQTFTVYAYSDLHVGNDFSELDTKLENGKVFSYDILSIRTENFSDNTYASQTYAARRAAGEGTVMFLSSFDGEGKGSKNSELYRNTTENTFKGGDSYGGFYDPQYLFETEIKNDLALFFGSELTGELNEEQARIRFLQRNGNDKRFRYSEEKKEAGIASEKVRLEKLRDDYLAVRAAFEEGKLTYTAVNSESGETVSIGWGEQCPAGYYVAGIGMGGLRSFSNLLYFQYSVTEEDKTETKSTGECVSLTVFKNKPKEDHDLCYETASFLHYLVKKYA